MSDSHAVSAALEDYIEAIFHLIARKRVARVRDIAQALSVHKSTVTAALRSLSEKHLVNYAPYEAATLTPKGRRLAREVVRRHKVIRSFLSEMLLVEAGVAEENACRMEHVMDKDVLRRLSLFAEFVKECPRAGEDWLQRFGDFLEHGGKIQPDPSKMRRFVAELKKKAGVEKAGR